MTDTTDTTDTTDVPDTSERTLGKQSPVKPTLTFWSLKNDCAFFIESQLELHFALQLEFDDNVKSYETQPFKTTYSVSGKKRTYTPDFAVVNLNNETFIIEVKPYRKTKSEAFQVKTKALRVHFQRENSTYLIFTENEIRDNDTSANQQILYPWRFEPKPGDELDLLTSYFHNGSASVIELQIQALELDLDKNLPVIALAHGLVECDLSQSLSDSSEIFWKATQH
ncbi:Tn7 transposase TnsA N-terminal domain-containing protein [Amphritea sp.]|uniref:Tn7 transposase TnsA N-terminal domain-containing protein n=1 Tax=Amphritea sp. TaxID=1872502 RepID=UPI003D0E822E